MTLTPKQVKKVTSVSTVINTSIGDKIEDTSDYLQERNSCEECGLKFSDQSAVKRHQHGHGDRHVLVIFVGKVILRILISENISFFI